MDIFQVVKDRVTVTVAAEAYGLTVSRGKALCPFHNDSHPSMFVHEKFFHCFVCDAGGDVVAFVSRLFGISPTNAARKLCDDFGVSYQDNSRAYERGRMIRQIEERKHIEEWSKAVFPGLCQRLRTANEVLAAREENEILHSVLETISRLQYFTDLLTYAGADERRELYKNHRKEVEALAQQTY